MANTIRSFIQAPIICFLLLLTGTACCQSNSTNVYFKNEQILIGQSTKKALVVDTVFGIVDGVKIYINSNGSGHIYLIQISKETGLPYRQYIKKYVVPPSKIVPEQLIKPLAKNNTKPALPSSKASGKTSMLNDKYVFPPPKSLAEQNVDSIYGVVEGVIWYYGANGNVYKIVKDKKTGKPYRLYLFRRPISRLIRYPIASNTGCRVEWHRVTYDLI